MSAPLSRNASTLVGFSAILLWSSLALGTSSTGAVPPFLLTALTFAVGGVVGLCASATRGASLAVLRQPWPVWVHGIGGLFSYHFFYFTAIKLAPPAEASLVAYLWPLLIVLLSAFLPGERLRPAHVAGALMGLAGTIVLLGGRAGGFGFAPEYVPGYLAAALSAAIWAVYSVTARRFQNVPSDLVGVFCLATAVLSVLCHLAFEQTIWPAGMGEWLAVVAMGIGPLGIAFYTWDIGMKHGDVRMLGITSYAAPVLSTLLLIAAGTAAPSWSLGLACALIVGGALVATLMARK